jgi:endonuclease
VKVEAFKGWLGSRYPKPAVAASYYSYAKRLDDAYGDLDALYEENRFDEILSDLNYSSSDAAAGKPDPSKLGLIGNPYNQLSNFRTGLRTYALFRDENGDIDVVNDAAIILAWAAIKDKREGKQFELERHLQESLRLEIAQLEVGLEVIDGGVERSVESGFIDILAKDISGALVVIELKAGQAKREALGQIAGYMGDLMDEESGIPVRGILVAADFDKSCLSGVRTISALSLKRYRFSFVFEEA